MIIVSGLPGSGKSYFASRLAQKLGATYISSDLMRKEMNAQGRYAFEDKLNVYEEMAHKAAEELRKDKQVVVDATFYRKEMRELFLTLATLLHRKIVLFVIVADERVVVDRLRRPRKDSEADLAVYKLVKSQYEQMEMDHLTIESRNDNLDHMLREATEYILKVDEVTSD